MIESKKGAVLAGVFLALVAVPLPASPGERALAPSWTLGPHPRVWITPARLARMRADYTANTSRWQRVRAHADAGLGQTPPDVESLFSLGLAYQMTGNAAYCRKAAEGMMPITASVDIIRADSFFYVKVYVPRVAAAYDWCYDQLTPAEKTRFSTWLMDAAHRTWNRLPGDSTWGLNDPHNNYFHGFMTTWLAAVAAHGDEARADGHIDFVRAKYASLVVPVLRGWNRGGLFPESDNYDSTTNLALNLDAHRTATGEDLFNTTAPSLQTDYFNEVVRWRLHATSPDKTSPYPYGDLADAELDEVHRIRTMVPLTNTTDATLRANGQHWLNTITPSTSNYSYAEWEFLFYDRNQAATPYEPSWPRYYFAPGSGFFLRRSAWNAAATYWGIWSGPLTQSHQNKDVNGFLIWKGTGWLVTDANLPSHSGIEQYTLFHNNFTFYPDPHPLQGSAYPPQRGQQWQEFPGSGVRGEAGQALRHESTAEFGFFEGRGTYAYDRSVNGGQLVLDDYVRKVVHVDPDLFVILDRVETRPTLAALTKQWRIFSNNAVTVQGKSYSFESGGYKLFGRTLLPLDAALSTRRLTQAIDGTTNVHEIVASAGGRTRDFFLNVFSLRPGGTTAVPAADRVVVESGDMEGVLADGWVVLAGRSELVQGPVRYTVNAPAATQHLLIDLMPDQYYAVTVDGGTAGQPRTSLQGSLRLTVPAGSHVVDLVPAVVAPALSVSDVSVMEGNSGDASATFTVALNAAGIQNVTVNYAVTAGTATAGVDFTAASGALSFPPGTTTRTIVVPVHGDDIPEANETFVIDLSGISGGTLADGHGQGTILDDDTARGFHVVAPCRLIDTRGPAGPSGGPALGANSSRTFPVSGRCGVPATARAVAVNLTAVNPGASGNLRLFPSGTVAPLASSINFAQGRTRANNAIGALGADGQMTVRCDMPAGSTAVTHFLADVTGYFE